jgi:acyl carrier protein
MASLAPLAPALDVSNLRAEIKALLVSELNLKGRNPESIRDDAALFGPDEGSLGLDSLDALQLAMAVEERFGVRIPEGEGARSIFQNVSSLANHLAKVSRG